MKKEFLYRFFKREEKEAISLPNFIYNRLSKMNMASSYKRSFRNIARHLLEFSEYTGLPVNSDSFTELTTQELVSYLNRRGLMLSTVKDIVQRVAAMVRAAGRAGYKMNLEIECVKIREEDSVSVYLNIEELNRLNEMKRLSPQAAAVRDRFLVGCFTALRISDYRRISKDDISKGSIVIKTQKTGATVVIPIHPVIEDVLARNGDDFPKMPSQQAFGNTIKRVCKKAGITESVIWERTVGGKTIKKKMKKYELVSSHTARRTGATLMYLAGIPTARIMLITGHKTEQSFFKYIRIGKEENAKELQQHEFFQRK